MATTITKYIGTLSHCLITAFCAVLNPWLGLIAGGFYYGRELTQAEYRYIEAHGGKRSNCSILCGIFPSAWTWKGFLDFFLPWIIAVAWFLYVMPIPDCFYLP